MRKYLIALALVPLIIAAVAFQSYSTRGSIADYAANYAVRSFDDFVDRIAAVDASERTAIVDSFMNAATRFPLVEDDSVAVFLYRGATTGVNVPGDANGWDGNAFPMARLADTDLWFRKQTFEPDARVDYKFVLGGSTWILDPLNPNRVSGGFGPNSELAMAQYVQPWEIVRDDNIQHGATRDTTFASSALGNTRTIRVYTPPGYDSSASGGYPVMLFHDGLDYTSLGSALNVLDNLIAAKEIVRIVAVFVPPVDRNNEYAFDQTGQFETFIVDELMPYVDGRYRTSPDPSKRGMIGASYGGLISTQICFNHPEQFGLCAPISPAYQPKNGLVMNELLESDRKQIRFYVDWGSYEPGIAATSRVLVQGLESKGYEVVAREWHEGHSWGSWRAHLDEALRLFYPGENTTSRNDIATPNPGPFELTNFPNPFSDSTTIAFRTDTSEPVVVKIFDLTGRLVETVAERRYPQGQQQIRWNALDYPVGVYLCQLEAGGRSETTRLVVVR